MTEYMTHDDLIGILSACSMSHRRSWMPEKLVMIIISSSISYRSGCSDHIVWFTNVSDYIVAVSGDGMDWN